MVNASDVVLYLSGSSVVDPKNSFGGAIQTVKVINKKNFNLFPQTTIAEALTGITKYLLLYVQNKNATEGMNNVVAHISFNTETDTDEVQIGKAAAGINATETRVTNILTAPANVNFSLAESYNTGIPLGKLNAGDYIGLWFKLIVSINNEPLSNRFGLKITFDPPAGSSSGGSGEGGGQTGGGGDQPPATIADYNIGVAADFGCNSDAKKTASNLKTFTMEHLLIDGDLSYESDGGCWIDLMGSSLLKLVIYAPGNHDDAEGSPTNLTNDYLKAIGQTKAFGVVKFKNMMVIHCNHYASFGKGSDQYNLIKNTLEAEKNNDNYKWRIVTMHEPCYSAPSHHGNIESFRDLYHPIFDANKVDIVCNGHNHNYQRTYPIRYNNSNSDNPTVHSTGNPNYTNPDGIIFITCGLAGRDKYSIDSTPAHVAVTNASEFGFGMLNITNNGLKLTGKFYRNSDISIRDQWSITKT